MATRESLMRGGAWVGRLILGSAFLYAGAMKLINPAAFATDIGHIRLVPHPIALGLSVYLPWLEIACALGVICRWRERGALAVPALLCAIFTIALISAAARGLNIHCGCFGESEPISSVKASPQRGCPAAANDADAATVNPPSAICTDPRLRLVLRCAPRALHNLPHFRRSRAGRRPHHGRAHGFTGSEGISRVHGGRDNRGLIIQFVPI